MTPDSFDIRYSEMSDLSYLEQWLDSSESCAPFPFNEIEKDTALQNWIGFSKYKASLTGLIDGKPCAIGTLFLMPYKKVAHHCSFYLVVDPKMRRQGIGTAMVRNLLNLAKTRFRLENVNAEVYEPNELISILQKLGFKQVVRQENFVKMDGKPSARLLMEKEL